MKTKLSKAVTTLIKELNKTCKKSNSIEPLRSVAKKHGAAELGLGVSRITFGVGRVAIKVLYSDEQYGDQNAAEAERWGTLSKVKGMENLFAPVLAKVGYCSVMPIAKTKEIGRKGYMANKLSNFLYKTADRFYDEKKKEVAVILWEAAYDLHPGNIGILKVKGEEKVVCIDYGC